MTHLVFIWLSPQFDEHAIQALLHALGIASLRQPHAEIDIDQRSEFIVAVLSIGLPPRSICETPTYM
jgi:hypothetical protein